MSVNLSENKTTATETMMQKSSIYLLGISNHIFNFIFKILQYPVVASLCWYVYFKVILKTTWFCNVNSCLWEISRNGDRIYSFSASYFPISQKTLPKIVHWPHYGIIIESSKFLSKCPCSWFGLLGLFFPASCPNETHFF